MRCEIAAGAVVEIVVYFYEKELVIDKNYSQLFAFYIRQVGIVVI